MKNILLVFLGLSFASYASELVYTPINPSFGGNPLNASMLMNKAQAQNKHKAHTEPKSFSEKMQESLERAFINRIVREITDEVFGESSDDTNIFDGDSMFVSGDHQIKMLTSNADSITIEITNLVSGEVTTIEIPRYGTNDAP